jgi:hypothetical protein
VQRLVEVEAKRWYAMSGKVAAKKQVARRRQAGEIIAEDIEWLEEEDFVLREGLERFGNNWEKISKGLKTRGRSPEECRQRFEQLYQ